MDNLNFNENGDEQTLENGDDRMDEEERARSQQSVEEEKEYDETDVEQNWKDQSWTWDSDSEDDTEEDKNMVDVIQKLHDAEVGNFELELKPLEDGEITNIDKRYPSSLFEEELETARVVINLEYLSFCRVLRKNSTKLALRFSFQNGLWFEFKSVDVSIYVEPLTGYEIRNRIIPPKAEIKSIVPEIKLKPSESKEDSYPPPPPSTESWNDEIPTKNKDDYQYYAFRTHQAVRFQSVLSGPEPESRREKDEEIYGHLPLFLEINHTGKFVLRFLLKVEFAYDSEIDEAGTRFHGSFERIYSTNILFDRDRDSKHNRLDYWDTCETDIKEEIEQTHLKFIAKLLQVPELVIPNSNSKVEVTSGIKNFEV